MLSQLRLGAMQVQRQADALSTQRTADVGKLDDQLKVIGPAQPDEAATLTQQRKALEAEKKALVAQQDQATKLTQSARDLSTQIVNLRRSQFNSQITSRAASPLSPAFWQSIIRPTQDDVARCVTCAARRPMPSAAPSAPKTAGCSLPAWWRRFWCGRWCGACLNACWPVPWFTGCRRAACAAAPWLWALAWQPWHHRRLGVVAALGAGKQCTLGFGYRQPDQSHSHPGGVQCLHHRPGPRHADAAASVLAVAGDPRRSRQCAGLVPKVLALALMVMMTMERMNSVIGASLALTVAVNGLTALVVALTFAGALLCYRRTLRKHGLERPTGLAGLIPFVMVIWLTLILLALLTGYLTLAYFLTAKLLWVSLVITCAYLLTTFFGDLCETLLSPRQRWPGTGVDPGPGASPPGPGQYHTGRHRPHGRAVPGTVAGVDAVGHQPSELLLSLGDWDGTGGKLLGNLNIVPQDILLALAIFLGGLFAIRVVKRWLSDRLLPETEMDAGMRASLVTLVGYLGFLFLAMLVMSTLRINLTSLTGWSVPCRSVSVSVCSRSCRTSFPA